MNQKSITKKQINTLKQKITELKQLFEDGIYLSGDRYAYDFKKWCSATRYVLKDMFEDNSSELTNFDIAMKLPETTATRLQWQRYKRTVMIRTAAELEAILLHASSSKVKMGQPIFPPKVFIAHGGKTEALNKVQTFIMALGAIPLIAEEEASKGRSVNEHIEWCLNNADCAIILGTTDDKNLKDGKLYPRPNVFIEIGRVQERFPDKVIYLLEKGASFSTNIAEKVYERFTQENMEKAFLKIVRELKAFGILKTISVKKLPPEN